MAKVRRIFSITLAVTTGSVVAGCGVVRRVEGPSRAEALTAAQGAYVASGDSGGVIAAGAREDAGQDGWALNMNSLAITRDGGGDWTTLPLPPSASTLADVSVLPSEVVSVSVAPADNAISVDTYSSRAGQWQEQQVPVSVPVGSAQLVDQAGVLNGVMVTGQSGSGFSIGSWLGTPDAGRTWQEHAAPIGGKVIATGGALWLAGGADNSSVYSSNDQGVTWQKADVPTTLDQTQPAAFGEVQPTPSGIVLTATDSSATQVITGSSSRPTWQLADGPVLNLGGEYGAGAPAVSSTADGVLWVLSPVNDLARVDLSTGQVSSVAANGLPANGTIDVHATRARSAWADYTTTTCQGKANCVDSSGVLATTDGGATWHSLSVPGAT